jgi:hypothetical protein
LRDGALKPEGSDGFACVVIGAPTEARARLLAATDESKTAGGGRMEIVLGRGRRVVVGPDVDAAALRRVLDVMERR